MNLSTPDKTAKKWLKKDEKEVLTGFKDGQDIFELAFGLDREPLSVLRHFDELGLFEFDEGSDEGVEFFGLALSGVPLNEAVLWCLADDARASNIDDLMKIGDMRLTLHFARDNSIHISSATEVDTLSTLMRHPFDLLSGAIRSIAHSFEYLTVTTLAHQVEARVSGNCLFLVKDSCFPPALMAGAYGTLSFGTKTRKRTSTKKAAGGHWKPKRYRAKKSRARY